MDFGVVFFQYSAVHHLKVFSVPVNLKASSNRIHESFVTFENFQRARDSFLSQKSGVQSTRSHEWVRNAFPIGEAASSCNPKRVKRCAAYGDGVGSFRLVESQRFGNAGCYCVGSLSYMIKTLVSYR